MDKERSIKIGSRIKRSVAAIRENIRPIKLVDPSFSDSDYNKAIQVELDKLLAVAVEIESIGGVDEDGR